MICSFLAGIPWWANCQGTQFLQTVFTRERSAKFEWSFKFELRSVRTSEGIADILISQCTRKRPSLQFSIPEREKIRRCMAHVWVPCQSNMHRARVSCASVHVHVCSARYIVYRRKWLEGHVALRPHNHNLEVNSRHSYGDLRDASLENTSGPSFELHNSHYASRWYNFAYTRCKILSFEWSLKLCTLLLCDNSLREVEHQGQQKHWWRKDLKSQFVNWFPQFPRFWLPRFQKTGL